jgi:hypothetical protein
MDTEFDIDQCAGIRSNQIESIDITAAVAKELDARLMAVGEVMTTDVVTAREQDSVLDLLGMMRRRGQKLPTRSCRPSSPRSRSRCTACRHAGNRGCRGPRLPA